MLGSLYTVLQGFGSGVYPVEGTTIVNSNDLNIVEK